MIPKADQVDGPRCHHLKSWVFPEPGIEFFCKGQMGSNPLLESLDPEMADHKPELESPETTPKWDPPIPKILHSAVNMGFQILGQDVEC